MYQLIFSHVGVEDEHSSVPLCIETSLERAKVLAREWMNAYIRYIIRCATESTEDELMTVEEKFFNEYLFAKENDTCTVSVIKLRTMEDLTAIMETTDFGDERQELLFNNLYTVSYDEINGITYSEE